MVYSSVTLCFGEIYLSLLLQGKGCWGWGGGGGGIGNFTGGIFFWVKGPKEE